MTVPPGARAGAIAQYRAAREDAVLADRSRLGRLFVGGKDALDLLHRLTTQDLRSLVTGQGTDYVFLKKDGGYETKTRDIVKPGVRVSVEYSQERGKPPAYATIVRVYEGEVRD